MNFIRTYLVYYPIFWAGYLFFNITKKTNWYTYISFRRLFVLTKGQSNDSMSERLSRANPPYDFNSGKGLLGNLNSDEVQAIVNDINKNGFHIFDAKLPTQAIDELVKFSLQTNAKLVPASSNGITQSLYDNKNVLSPRYEFSEQDILNYPLIQQITTDQSLFVIAQKYLSCKPIQDLTAMWWSATFSKEASSEAAQLFHFDMDRIKFIKFFFYLTDVGSHNGPHCYVRGSHKVMPESVWRDGRITDEDVKKNFLKNDILEIAGPKGTVIAVDTRGLHKGKVLESGERLLLQVEFTNSLFGTTYNRINLSKSGLPEIKKLMSEYKNSFQRYDI